MPPFCLAQEAWSVPVTMFTTVIPRSFSQEESKQRTIEIKDKAVIPRSFPWEQGNKELARSKPKSVIFSLLQDGGADRPDRGTCLSESVLIEPRLVCGFCANYGERQRSSGAVDGSHSALSSAALRQLCKVRTDEPSELEAYSQCFEVAFRPC